jgi:hypothetical protein
MMAAYQGCDVIDLSELTLDTDTVLHDKCISVMPLDYCRTSMKAYEKLT